MTVIYWICYSFLPVIGNVCMYLMQQHNEDEYQTFISKFGCCKSSSKEGMTLKSIENDIGVLDDKTERRNHESIPKRLHQPELSLPTIVLDQDD